MNKFRLISVFVVLAMVFSFTNVSTAAATSPNPLDDGGWELVAHMSNSGGMFDGNGELMPGYSYGTFVANPVASTPDFQREFPVTADEILFITGDLAVWGIADYGDLRTLIDAQGSVYPYSPNIAFEIGVNGVVSNTMGNVISRAGALEDPWISMEGDHFYAVDNQRIVWGENNWNYQPGHVALKNSHGGINVYVKAAGNQPVPVTFQEGTATFSQSYPCCALPVDQAVDGYIGVPVNGVLNGWAIHPEVGQNQTAVWETTSDISAAQLDFKLYQYWGGAHNLGRFRLSYSTDDRSTFADGLNSGGDVTANWTVLTGATVSGTGGETFTVLGDNSILVSGNNPATTVYSMSFSGSFSGITGIRLEALSDPSLFFNGPGRQANGNFTLTEITLDATAPTDTSAPTASPTQSPAANALGWNNTDVTVTWNWSDEAGGSGIDNAACTTSSTSSGEGEITLNATCNDLAGNEGSASYTVMVDKTLPVADAGSDQSMHAGYTVNLDGGASSDDNTLPEELSYNWSFFSTPGGNTATLNNANTAIPSFTPNVSGEYVVQLIVTDDADNDSEPVFVTLSSLNMAPTADATATPMLPLLGQSVSLDGSASNDPDGDTIYYQWTVTSKPVGSAASLTNATSAMASITPDVSGTYEMTLTVSDFLEAGTPVTVSFVASTAEEFSQMQIITVSTVVTALQSGEITTAGNQNAFGNFLTNTMSQIQKGKLDKAIADLEKAIARTDGCALRGAPDGNGAGMDWVTTCDAQASVYDSLVAALQALQN